MPITFGIILPPNPRGKNLISNSEQLFNSTDLSPITFGVILPPKLRGKISTNSQINPTTLDENKNSKICTIKIFLGLTLKFFSHPNIPE